MDQLAEDLPHTPQDHLEWSVEDLQDLAWSAEEDTPQELESLVEDHASAEVLTPLDPEATHLLLLPLL